MTEFIIATKIAKNSNEERFEVPQRDREFEKRIYKTVFTVYCVTYIIISVLLVILL